MKIISKLFVIVLSLTLAACGSNKKFSLKGSIEGQNELNILIYSPNEAFSGYDTIKVTKGKFSYEQELTDSAIITLLFPKNIQTQIIAYPGDRLTYKVSASAMAKASVEGSTENELLTKYRLSVAELAGTSLTAKAKNFIKEHPQTLAAIAVFEQHILANSGREKNDLKETFELLHKSQPNNPYLTRLAQQLYAETQVGVGQKVPPISLHPPQKRHIWSGGNQTRRRQKARHCHIMLGDMDGSITATIRTGSKIKKRTTRESRHSRCFVRLQSYRIQTKIRPRHTFATYSL